MMKWITLVVLAALVAGSWMMYSNKTKEMASLTAKIDQLENAGTSEEEVSKLKIDLNSMEGEKTFNGILLTFLSAGLVGIFFVVYLLPFFAQRVTHSVYDSAEMVEKDVMHDARSLMAQGDYEGAIAAFKQAAAADPLNRLPWVEIAKIQKTNLEDPAAAIATIRHALESQAWEVNDAAYFLFRLAELYDEVEGNRASAVAIMNQVIEQFPETRHSANARNKLHEWEVNDAAYFLFRLAELYDEVEGDRASAVAIMQQVVEQFPGTRHSANASHKIHEWSTADAAAAAAAEEQAFIDQQRQLAEQQGQPAEEDPQNPA